MNTLDPVSTHIVPPTVPAAHPLAQVLPASVLAAAALGLLGCGDEPAAQTRPDAGLAQPDACDPLADTGCPEGQKCSVRIDSEVPFMTTVTCVPAGTVRAGGMCGFGPPGSAGYDDCEGTSFCLDGVCTPICADQPGGCADVDMACTPYGAFFGDPALGLCTPVCDPVDAQGCEAGDGCYLRLATGQSTCNRAGVLGQGEPCAALNACAAGLGCVLLSPQAQGNLCTAFCDPATGTTSLGGSCADALGSQAVQPACVPVNRFYGDTPDVPATVGMCLDCATAGYADLPVCSPGQQGAQGAVRRAFRAPADLGAL